MSNESESSRPASEPEAIGATVAEARKIHQLVKKHRFPQGVRRFEVKYGKDSTGNPAVWIRFIIDEQLSPRKDEINELNSLRRDVQSELLKSSLRFWPYVEFRVSS